MTLYGPLCAPIIEMSPSLTLFSLFLFLFLLPTNIYFISQCDVSASIGDMIYKRCAYGFAQNKLSLRYQSGRYPKVFIERGSILFSMPRVTVLISGSGSNLQALIDAEQQGKFPNTKIVSVISSSKKAYGLQRAEKANIPTKVHSLYSYNKGIPKEDTMARQLARVQFEKDLADVIMLDKPDLVVCAGWLLILGPNFLSNLSKDIKIINLHPALPGTFDGTTHAIEMAWNKCQESKKPLVAGCMVHYVIEEVDKGKPLIVKELTITPGEETLEQYEERVHKEEHVAIVEATIKALDL